MIMRRSDRADVFVIGGNYSAASAACARVTFRFDGAAELRFFGFSVLFGGFPCPSMAAPIVSETRPAADLTGSLARWA